MFPTLFELGPVVIRSLNILLVVALFVGLFVFWRKGKEEHYDEMELFDGLFFGQLLGVIAARIAFIAIHFDRFGLDIIKWVDIFSEPGFTLFVFLVVSGGYLYRYSVNKKWDAFEILDFWVLSVSFSMIFVWIGYFLAGILFGTPTQLPVGIVFPGVFEKHHPVQLYVIIFYILLSWYLAWVEFRYRTFEWYRRGKNTAQTGFLFSVFLIANGVVFSLLSFITPPAFLVQGLRIDVFISILMAICGGVLLYARSGRQFFSPKKRARTKKLERLEQVES